MKTTVADTSQRSARTTEIEALAFYLGAHGIDPAPVKDQIEARFTEDTLREKEEPLRNLHVLEAKREQVRKERPESEALWQKVRKELGDTPPPYFHALFMAFFGAFALLVDALVLAPSMDMIGVALPALQYFVAAGFAMLFTTWFELCGLSYLRAKDRIHRGSSLAAGGAAAFTLLVWGLLRGHQLQFAAGIAGNPLGDFLAAHPFLAAAFFTLITLATPMVGAFAFLSAWRDYSAARTWRQVRERFESHRREEVELPRRIQAEVERLAQFDRRKEAECRQWKESFNHYYDRGVKNGSRREPLWSVVWKSALGVFGGTLVAVFVPELGFVADSLLPVIPGVALFLFFNHRRLHPSEERYLRRENTKFVVIPGKPIAAPLPQPPIRLLPKGDQE